VLTSLPEFAASPFIEADARQHALRIIERLYEDTNFKGKGLRRCQERAVIELFSFRLIVPQLH
jgi:hypothetical protein